MWEAENKGGRKGGRPVAGRAPASIFPQRKPLQPEFLLSLNVPGRKAQTKMPFSSGSSVGQGLLHAKEKRNLPAEYFLDILQDARPP